MIKAVFSQFAGVRATTKVDVAIGCIAALLATAKAVDTINQYKSEQDDINEENSK